MRRFTVPILVLVAAAAVARAVHLESVWDESGREAAFAAETEALGWPVDELHLLGMTIEHGLLSTTEMRRWTHADDQDVVYEMVLERGTPLSGFHLRSARVGASD